MSTARGARKRRATVLGAVLSIPFVACDGGESRATETAVRDSAGVAIIEVGDPAALELPAWRVSTDPAVVIGSDDRAIGHDLFGVRGAAPLSNGRIMVANGGTQELRFFGPDGSFLQDAGGEGEGPGEFSSLHWVGVIRGDTILAYDDSQRRLSTFTGEGAFVASVRIMPPHERSFPEPRGAFAHGEVVFVPGFDRVFGNGERRDTIPFIRYDRSGTIRDTLAVLPGEEMFFVQAGGGAMRSDVPFGRDVLAAVGSSTLAIGITDRYRISLIDASGALRTEIRAEPPARPVTEADITAWQEERLASAPEEIRAMVETLYEQLPARSTYPAFSNLIVDASGFVWVREPVGPTAREDVWVIYSPEGTPSARLTVPPGLNIVSIEPGRILVLERDELDRPVLRVHALDRTGS